MKRSLGMVILVSGTILVALVAAACGGSSQSLENTTWILTQYSAADGTLTDALTTTEVSATFADGVVQGSGGCNNYNGTYQIDGSSISIPPMATTLMACEQPIVDQETAFLTGMLAATSYGFQGSDLVLKNEAGGVLLVFRAE